MERYEKWSSKRLTLEQIRQYGVANSNEQFIEDVDSLLSDKEKGLHDSMWKTAYSAPHRFADRFDRRILVILDEFQNITRFVYRDEKCKGEPDETLAGSFHYYSESKIAPMLVTGSYAGWLLNVINQYLEAGRLKPIRMSPYLTPEEGMQAVYKYAQFYREPITNETAIQINELCQSDPFFISCVIQSEYEDKDLSVANGVINTVEYEISDQTAEMYLTWGEYLEKILPRVNDQHGKNILLYLNKYSDRYWTPSELKQALNLDLDTNEIQQKLVIFSEADVIERGVSNIQFRGLQDGTLNLVLRNRFEEELSGSVPNLKQEFSTQIEELRAKNSKLRGRLNSLSGLMAEHLLATAFRSRKRFALSDFFQNGIDAASRLNIVEVRERVLIQRDDGKGMEIDVVAFSKCKRVVLVEVKKTEAKIGAEIVEDFQEKVEVFARLHPENRVGYFVVGGFYEKGEGVV